MVRRTRPGISGFPVKCGAYHWAALCADPLAYAPENDDQEAAMSASFSAPRPVSALDPIKTRRDAALKQRPVEAERESHIAALDHLIGLLRRARHAADWDAAFENAGLGARHQGLHVG